MEKNEKYENMIENFHKIHKKKLYRQLCIRAIIFVVGLALLLASCFPTIMEENKRNKVLNSPSLYAKDLMQYYNVNTYTDLRHKLMNEDSPLYIVLSEATGMHFLSDTSLSLPFEGFLLEEEIKELKILAIQKTKKYIEEQKKLNTNLSISKKEIEKMTENTFVQMREQLIIELKDYYYKYMIDANLQLRSISQLKPFMQYIKALFNLQ